MTKENKIIAPQGVLNLLCGESASFPDEQAVMLAAGGKAVYAQGT